MEILNKNKNTVTVKITENSKIKDIVSFLDVKENRLCIFINNKYPEQLDLDYEVKKDDIVRIYPELQGGNGQGAKIASTVVQIGALVATAGLAGSLTGINLALAATGVLVGSTFIIAGIQSLARRSEERNDQDKTEIPNYGLSSGRNSARVLQPLPIVFGTIRINPDISSKPYNEPTERTIANSVDIPSWGIAGTPYDFDHTIFTGFWSDTIGGDFFQGTSLTVFTPIDNYIRLGVGGNPYHPTLEEAQDNPTPSIGDQVAETWVWVDNALANPPIARERFVLWSDLQANGIGATFIDPLPGTTVTATTYEFDEISQEFVLPQRSLKQIFNYGYGDLTISGERIGNTDASIYEEYNEYINTETITSYPLSQVEPDILGAGGYPVFTPTTEVNGNVYSVDGNVMKGTDDPSLNDNWVYRESPENTFAIMLDMSGSQYRPNSNVPQGVQAITRKYEFQYREVGTATWFDIDNDLDGITAFGGVCTLSIATVSQKYENVIFQNGLTPSKYEVRFRKYSPDDTDGLTVCEMQIEQVRFYVSDTSNNYIAQNRQGVSIQASAKINGTLDNYSALVQAKCWKYDGVSAYTWDFSDNPADWYLYFLRGAFENTSANGTLLYPFSPTTGWVNSADHPDNGEQIFGGGVSDSQIDFDSIQAWWNYCDSEGLTFNAVLNSNKNVLTVLQEIASVGRGSPNMTIGKWGVIWEDQSLPVAVFTPDNIIKDSFKVTYNNIENPDIIEVEYVDENNDYVFSTVEQTVPTVANALERQKISAWGVTNESQAQRFANLLVARILFNKRLVEFSTDAEGLIVSRGDVIIVSHDVTQWGFFGRITDIEHDGVNVVSFGVSCQLDEQVTYVALRNIYNQINTYECSVSNNRIILIDTWSLTDAPYYIDQVQTINNLSTYPNSYCHDWIFTAGDVETPGKKMRIVEVSARSTNDISIKAIDEEDAYYTYDVDGPLPPFAPPANPERIKARVYNSNVILENNLQNISWEKDGCDAVSIMISVNGGAYIPLISSGATIYANYVELYYSTGDNISMIITPVYVDSPYDVQSESLSFTV